MPGASDSKRQSVPSVTRAVALLNALAAGPSPARLADLSRSLDIPRSSTLALCNTLVEAGLLTRSAEAGYSLGPHVLELSRAYLAGTDIHRSFEQVLGREGALDEHTLVLSVLEHTDVVYVGRRLGRRAVSVPYELGMRLPANCTASGKVLLSELADEEVRARFADGLQALTSHSIVDIEVLLRELERWRSAGFALDEQETALGMTCVGAAVYDSSRHAVAAIAMSAVTAALDEGALEQTAAAVRRIADEISATLGAPARG